MSSTRIVGLLRVAQCAVDLTFDGLQTALGDPLDRVSVKGDGEEARVSTGLQLRGARHLELTAVVAAKNRHHATSLPASAVNESGSIVIGSTHRQSA